MPAKLNGLRTVAVLVLVLLAGAMAARGEDGKGSEDQKKMQGEWTAPSADGEKTVYTFKDDKLTVKAPSRTYEITVTLDAAAKPEKTIDLKIDKAPDDAKGKTSKGIYKFDGDDKLVICVRPEGERRPEKYEQVGFEQILVELTRSKANASK